MRGKALLAVVMLSSSFVWGQTNAAAPGQKARPDYRHKSVGAGTPRGANGDGVEQAR